MRRPNIPNGWIHSCSELSFQKIGSHVTSLVSGITWLHGQDYQGRDTLRHTLSCFPSLQNIHLDIPTRDERCVTSDGIFFWSHVGSLGHDVEFLKEVKQGIIDLVKESTSLRRISIDSWDELDKLQGEVALIEERPTPYSSMLGRPHRSAKRVYGATKDQTADGTCYGGI